MNKFIALKYIDVGATSRWFRGSRTYYTVYTIERV